MKKFVSLPRSSFDVVRPSFHVCRVSKQRQISIRRRSWSSRSRSSDHAQQEAAQQQLSKGVQPPGKIEWRRSHAIVNQGCLSRMTHSAMPATSIVKQCIQQCTQYRAGATLLCEQTKMTWALLLLRGVRLESDGRHLLHATQPSGGILLHQTDEYRKLVNVAVWDLAKVIPFLTVLLAPGGSVLMLMLLRGCPQALPSTFNTSSAGRLEVADRMLGLQRNLKDALIAKALLSRIVVDETRNCKPRGKVHLLLAKLSALP